MASIALSNVSIQFPMYQGSARSLKKTLMSMARPSSLRHQNNRIVVNALDDVSFTIEHGERIGLVGHNGAGKTTLLRVLAGVYEPTGGDVEVEGKVSALLDASLGLNPDATGYENIYLRGLYLGWRPSLVRKLAPSIAEFTELGEFLHMPVRTYSSGMTVRLAFAIATAAKPEILIMDEWLMAGDAQFLDKARARVDAFVRQSEILVLASHAMPIIKQWCSKAIWMEAGRVVMMGDTDSVVDAYSQKMNDAGPPPTISDDPRYGNYIATA